MFRETRFTHPRKYGDEDSIRQESHYACAEMNKLSGREINLYVTALVSSQSTAVTDMYRKPDK
jgi:hypothetical protein